MAEPKRHILDSSADQALFMGEIQGLVVTCYQNERPLAGLAGLMDWRLHGAISEFIRQGAVSGAPGECVYLPVSRNGMTYHLILVGGGYSSEPGVREGIPAETLAQLQANLTRLGLERIGISKSDLGEVPKLKGTQVWVVN